MGTSEIKTYIFSCFFAVGVIFSPNPVIAQFDDEVSWNLEKEKNGVRVYTKKSEEFKIKAFRAKTIVDVPPELLLDIMRQADQYEEWMSHIATSYEVERENDDQILVYTESSVPWPFSNRDIITLSEIFWEADTAFVKITGIADKLPEKKGIVRMPFAEGIWSFTPLGDNKTAIDHIFQGDPGGSIPSWLVNTFIVDGPYKTMLGLRNYAVELQESLTDLN